MFIVLPFNLLDVYMIHLCASDIPLNIGDDMLSDNSLLLQPFCTKAQYLSGKARVDLIEKVAGIVNFPIMK